MTVFRRVITVDDEAMARRAGKGLVSVVDDDANVLKALSELIAYEGYACLAYASVEVFLAAQGQPRFAGPRCILSDMAMPEKNGLQLQSLLPVDSDQPLIFMSGIASVSQAAQAFRQGAVHFLSKPLSDTELFAAIEEALRQSQAIQQASVWRQSQGERMARLTPRERELVRLLPQGLSIKEMARLMGVTDRAIKLYKRSAMDKLEVRSVYELVRLQLAGLL